jgi:hypothetical protein
MPYLAYHHYLICTFNNVFYILQAFFTYCIFGNHRTINLHIAYTCMTTHQYSQKKSLSISQKIEFISLYLYNKKKNFFFTNEVVSKKSISECLLDI